MLRLHLCLFHVEEANNSKSPFHTSLRGLYLPPPSRRREEWKVEALDAVSSVARPDLRPTCLRGSFSLNKHAEWDRSKWLYRKLHNWCEQCYPLNQGCVRTLAGGVKETSRERKRHGENRDNLRNIFKKRHGSHQAAEVKISLPRLPVKSADGQGRGASWHPQLAH